ncbi:MAG: hypothetical protein LC623_06585 [Halobacteriales archaeon]|nr:hypothetical protein [Halobacteriales archaeon]
MAWTLLLYRLPPNPSAPRVAAWRALKRLPGGYLQDGTFVAPSTDETDLQLHILAHDIRNQGGEASLLHCDRVDDARHLKARLAASTQASGPPNSKKPSKRKP